MRRECRKDSGWLYVRLGAVRLSAQKRAGHNGHTLYALRIGAMDVTLNGWRW